MKESLGGIMTEVPSHFVNALQSIASEIFQAGVKLGSEQMRAAILKAAQTPFTAHDDFAGQGSVAIEGGRHSEPLRARRGAVRDAITQALRLHTGLGELELGQAVAGIDPSVSPRSVGGELRRMRNRLYRLDRGLWFLIAQESEKEAAGSKDDPADLLNQTTKGDSDAETPIAA